MSWLVAPEAPPPTFEQTRDGSVQDSDPSGHLPPGYRWLPLGPALIRVKA